MVVLVAQSSACKLSEGQSDALIAVIFKSCVFAFFSAVFRSPLRAGWRCPTPALGQLLAALSQLARRSESARCSIPTDYAASGTIHKVFLVTVREMSRGAAAAYQLLT